MAFNYEKIHDIVIVGSGAGGATLAHELADTGLNIVILERGKPIESGPENWDPRAVFVDRKYRTTDVWYDKHGHPFHPNTHYWAAATRHFTVQP